MDLHLEGKSVVVTGASKGIGYACAALFAEEGCDVHLVARTAADLEAARDRLRARYNRGVEIHPMDLSDSTSIPKLMAAAGDIDILVNNAGAIPGGDIRMVDEARWREAWDLKVFGYINLTRAGYAHFKQKGGGVIVNVIGLAGEKPDFNYIAGSAGNASLMAFTRGMGGASLDDNIRVCAVNPGPVETDRLVTLLKTRSQQEHGTEDRWRDYLARNPLGRAATAEEIANLVVFLASDRASYTTGTVYSIDGGIANRAPSF